MAHLSAGPLAPHARLAHGWEPEPRERVKAAFLSSLSRRREPAAPTPSTIRSSRAFKHPNGAALRIAPLFGPALSDHVRAGPLPTGFAESREGRSRDEAPASYSRRARPLRRDLPHALCGDPGALKSYATLLGHRRSCAPGRRRRDGPLVVDVHARHDTLAEETPVSCSHPPPHCVLEFAPPRGAVERSVAAEPSRDELGEHNATGLRRVRFLERTPHGHCDLIVVVHARFRRTGRCAP